MNWKGWALLHPETGKLVMASAFGEVPWLFETKREAQAGTDWSLVLANCKPVRITVEVTSPRQGTERG